MARHIMAVCVVCLLCADRLPCEEHFEGMSASVSVLEPLVVNDGKEYQFLNARVYHENDRSSDHIDEYSVGSSAKKRHRTKRHASHAIENAIQKRPEITEDFLRRIFDEYGENDGNTMHISEFRRMLKQLGLQQFFEQKFISSSSTANNNTCISDVTLVDYVRPHDADNYHHDEQVIDCPPNGTEKLCNDVHHARGVKSNEATNYTLGEQDLLNLCPVLLYQLSSNSESERTGCIENTLLANVHNFEEKTIPAKKEDIMFVWIYAFISVFACGILGLVGVAIIPFMDSHFYKHIIQFLVSLAVGTMTGDALLHLLPHAVANQTESNMIFKGLVCMSGIVFFYITEHGLTMISEWRKSVVKQETKKPSRAKVVRDPDSSMNNSIAGDKLCKSKYSSYPYCYDEIAMDSKNDVWMHMPHNASNDNKEKSSHHPLNIAEKRRKSKDIVAGNGNDAHETAQSLLSTSQNSYAPISELNHHHNHHIHNHHQQMLDNSNTLSTNLDDHSMVDGGGVVNGSENGNKSGTVVNNDTVTVILREHESSHHGHSHKHGHVHSPPESLSAVAWMIIMGDGLHNFTDGMAIGAAFAENIAGGFSTSLAVFCHELPHELGDFAILMKAGMSVKSAVYYNLLTGVLSFIGMVFGIFFGQSHEAAQWMFAAAAGLFIYIALVDMMPELSAAHKSLQQLALQTLGMTSGVLIMLLIAIYEGDLMNAFSSSPTATPSASHSHSH